jgi:triphosphatase
LLPRPINSLIQFTLISQMPQGKNMPKEIELKLIIDRADIDKVMAIEWLKPNLLLPWTEAKFFNTYYDTEDNALLNKGYAMRIRRVGDEYYQTIKSAGKSKHGLHERDEWEWPLESDALDLTILPDELSFIKTMLLSPVFTTDFIRKQCLVEWESSTIEIALDQGEIKVGDLEEPICELELEIKKGEPKGLIDFAKLIKRDVTAKPFDQSKAERGYRLRKVYLANCS